MRKERRLPHSRLEAVPGLAGYVVGLCFLMYIGWYRFLRGNMYINLNIKQMKKIIIILMLLFPIEVLAQVVGNVPADEKTRNLEQTISKIEELKSKLALINNRNPFDIVLDSPLVNSLSIVRDSLSRELHLLREELHPLRNKYANDHHYHIFKAGKFVRKAYALELGLVGFGVVSGVCLVKGYSDDKKSVKAVGYIFAAGGFASAISAITFHFKSGYELRLGAGKIGYVF